MFFQLAGEVRKHEAIERKCNAVAQPRHAYHMRKCTYDATVRLA